MAYITKEQVAAIRTALKKEFPKFVFSVVRDHHSSVTVSIMKGEVDFDGIRQVNTYHTYKEELEQCYCDYDINNQPFAAMFNKMIKIMKGQGWYDKSDAMTDYFNTAYYMSLNVGKWDKPYEIVKK